MIKYAPGCNAVCRSAGDCNCPTPDKAQGNVFRAFMEEVRKRLPSPHQEHRLTLEELYLSIWDNLGSLNRAIREQRDVTKIAADIAGAAAQIAGYEGMSQWYPRSRT